MKCEIITSINRTHEPFEHKAYAFLAEDFSLIVSDNDTDSTPNLFPYFLTQKEYENFFASLRKSSLLLIFSLLSRDYFCSFIFLLQKDWVH